MPEKVILTGGVKTQYDVSVYNTKGFLENWPKLTKGRAGHGCGHYVNTDNKVVSVWTFSFRRKTSLVKSVILWVFPKNRTFSSERNPSSFIIMRKTSGSEGCKKLCGKFSLRMPELHKLGTFPQICNFFKDFCSQVYLVVGGFTSTTELLTEGASAWAFSGPVPLYTWKTVISINNDIITTGECLMWPHNVGILIPSYYSCR